MNTHKTNRYLILGSVITLLVISACQAVPTAAPQSTEPPVLTTEPAVQVTEPALQPTMPENQITSDNLGGISLDYLTVAEKASLETVPATPAADDQPWWSVGPEYRQIKLDGFVVGNHMLKPRINIYPVSGLITASEYTSKMATNLQARLQSQASGGELPFLPVMNAKQVMQAQVQYLDFKNGKGVRYLTMYTQGMVAITNYELVYTFQGLTSDGKYYVSAVLPVAHPDLPANGPFNGTPGEYQNYVLETTRMLNEQSADKFIPDLTRFDQLIDSIEVKE